MPFMSHFSKLLRPSPFTILCTVLTLSLFVNLVAIVKQIRLLTPSSDTYSYVGRDYPREAPIKLRTVNQAFSDDLEHYHLEGRQAAAEWNALHPEGQGSIYLGESAHINEEVNAPYQISMFHQLQCLNHLRAVFIYGNDQPARTEHCSQYLVQSIVCLSDTTLEEGGVGTRLMDGSVVAPANNNTHTCKDWTQLYDFAAENRAGWNDEQIELEAELSRGTLLADLDR
ncbi:hypothetical protein D9758_009383 [Tetrapyrgos nigripes]|uniref:Oxidase ustYa n=1 Tax=Tetrapyrgos nigripes TaxID=182062 RepID=A0A8H5D3M5_9AGAR|nr:hypothetical protein D9758_009383 [Tetrapyrgos nigripes]